MCTCGMNPSLGIESFASSTPNFIRGSLRTALLVWRPCGTPTRTRTDGSELERPGLGVPCIWEPLACRRSRDAPSLPPTTCGARPWR
jgi:hypothetical protein